MIDPMAALSRDEDVSGTRKNPLGSVASWAKVHRRADPTDEPSEPPVEEHQAGERIDPVAAPEPAPGNHVNLLLPIGLIAAVAGWMWLLASGTVARLRRVLGSPPHPPMRILAESLGWTRRRTKAERTETKERRSDFWGPRQ